MKFVCPNKQSFVKVITTSSAKGFTLIELLIVIAILGILATAVLSAINPVEQINRGRDTGTQSDAEQALSAIQRYDAAKGYLPWQASPNDPVAVAWTSFNTSWSPSAISALSPNTVLGQLGPLGTQEVQAAYVNRISGSGYRGLFIYNEGAGSSTYLCFLPQSGSFQQQANNRCKGVSGTLPGDFPPVACNNGAPSLTTSYICLP